MLIRVARSSAAVAAQVRSAPAEAGAVHSVFDRAINLAWHDGCLVTLQGPGPLSAPFAAALERLPRQVGRPGAPVRRRGDIVDIGGVSLDWRGAAVADTAMPASRERPGSAVSAILAQPSSPSGGGLDGAAGRCARSQLADGVRCRDAAAFAGGAIGLIGLGEGLTPAGDDCLVGALAVIHRFSRAWLVEHPEIRDALADRAASATTAIAGEFIAHALAGHFAESLLDLMTASSPETAREAAARLLLTGATSGADTMVGIRLALAAL